MILISHTRVPIIGQFVANLKVVESVGIKIKDSSNKIAGELDVVTKNEIIEVEASLKVADPEQFPKMVDSSDKNFLNPNQKGYFVAIAADNKETTIGRLARIVALLVVNERYLNE